MSNDAVQFARNVCCRKRNKIDSRSTVNIKEAAEDLYVAVIDDKLTVKLGPRGETPDHLRPNEHEGWKIAATGRDFCVWEKQ